MRMISVVLPCYRAASIARASVARLRDSLPACCEGDDQWEIIVVDDGGGDFAHGEWFDDPSVRLLSLPTNRGKGAAVRAGMLAARGDVRIFTDVDLPFGVAHFDLMAAYVRERGFHVVIGDRTLPGSSYRTEIPLARRLASAVFTTFVGTIVTGGFFDTQCGLKALRGDVADELFRLSRIDRFAFDVELIYVALKHRLDIKRIPVRLECNETSAVRLFRDALRGFADVFRIKYYQLRGAYASNRLDSIVAMDVADVAQRSSSLPVH